MEAPQQADCSRRRKLRRKPALAEEDDANAPLYRDVQAVAQRHEKTNQRPVFDASRTKTAETKNTTTNHPNNTSTNMYTAKNIKTIQQPLQQKPQETNLKRQN